MSNKIKIAVVIGLVFAFAATMTIVPGCTGAGEETATVTTGEETLVTNLKVGFIAMTLTGNSFQIDMANAAKSSGEALGLEVTLAAPQTFDDYAAQLGIVEDLITKEYDLIILDPGHPTALIPAVEEANAAGIPVILVDNTLDDPELALTYIGTGNEEGAYLGTKYLCEEIGGEGKIVHLEGEAGNPNAALRKEGMLRALEEYPNVELVVSQNAHWTAEGGLTVMENALQANPDIAGVFAANDDAALGAVEACENKGVSPVIVAFDGTPQGIEAIDAGTMTATVAQNPARMVNWAMRLGLAYIQYIKNDPDVLAKPFPAWIDSGVSIIDKSNVADYME